MKQASISTARHLDILMNEDLSVDISQLDVPVSRMLRRWEPEIAGIKSTLILAYILLFFALLYITYINRTGFSI